MDLEEAALFAARVAEEAGERILKYFGSNSYRFKSDKSIQSKADLESELFIREKIASEFQDIPILTEERDELPDTTGYLWVCDELDGTTNFVNGQPTWAISIAVLQNFEPLVGAIRVPILGETVSAVRGRGTFLKRRDGTRERGRVRSSEFRDFRDIYTFCSWQSNNFVSDLGNIRAFGSTAYHLSQFACGRTAGGWEVGAKVWDLAAGMLLAREAGGIVRLIDGDDPMERVREKRMECSIRKLTVRCIFAADLSIYELMRADMVKHSTQWAGLLAIECEKPR